MNFYLVYYIKHSIITPTVLNLFVIAFELGLLVTVLVVVVDERVLLNVDGTVRGLAVGTVDEVRTLVVVLDAPKAAVGDLMEEM